MWHCIDYKKFNLTVGGYWEGDFVKYISVWIYFCPGNDRNDPNCRTLNELYDLLFQRKKLYFTLMYPVFYFDPSDLQSPLKYEYEEYFSTLSINLLKRERIYFKPVEIKDDQNLLTTEFVSKTITVFRGF